MRIAGAEEVLTEFAEKMNIPVITTIMGKVRCQAITGFMWVISECMEITLPIWLSANVMFYLPSE